MLLGGGEGGAPRLPQVYVTKYVTRWVTRYQTYATAIRFVTNFYTVVAAPAEGGRGRRYETVIVKSVTQVVTLPRPLPIDIALKRIPRLERLPPVAAREAARRLVPAH